jgi:Glycosyltransferase family 87
VFLKWMWLWRILAAMALIVFGGFLGASVLGSGKPTDAEVYWSAQLGPELYAKSVGQLAYLYSPVFAQITLPLRALPFPAFYFLMMAANLAALIWLVGPLWGLVAVLALPPVSLELGEGNINLLIAVTLVLGARRAGWWAMPLLSKVGPGVVLVYDVAGRRWRHLLLTLLAVMLVVAISAAFAPHLWGDWVRLLVAADRTHVPNGYQWLQFPLSLRLVAASLVAGAAGLLAWPALVPVAALFAMPVLWTNTLTVLLAVPRLLAGQFKTRPVEAGWCAGCRPQTSRQAPQRKDPP